MPRQTVKRDYYVVLPDGVDLNIFLPEVAAGFESDQVHPLQLAVPVVPNPSEQSIEVGKVKKVTIIFECDNE